VLGFLAFAAIVVLLSFLISIGKSESSKQAQVIDRNTEVSNPAPALPENAAPAQASTVANSKPATTPPPAATTTTTVTTAPKVEAEAKKAVPAPQGVKVSVRALEQTWVNYKID